MLSSNWLDAIIFPQLHNGAAAIAQAICQSPQFLASINDGLRRPVDKIGPSTSQAVREELKKLFCGTAP
jgi:hypothetical protein